MEDRNMAIPSRGGAVSEPEVKEEVVEEKVQEEVKEQPKEEPKLTKEESDFIEKVFFEEDESVRLRDGISYKIPPLGLKDAKNLMKKLNSVDTGVIIANLIADDTGEDNYDQLIDVLFMAFKPYYKNMTADYLGEYVDIASAKAIIDIMIGLNGLKKSL
jgi:hypothetical protein